MTAYIDFYRERSAQLREIYPDYSKKTIRCMISDEWKQKKGAGACITARKSTLQYEAIKTLIQRVNKFDISISQEICDIVNSKSCSYCDKQLKRKSTGDHFMPVVANSKTPILSNFSFLTIPCCQECNSSKTNKNWKDFAKIKNISDDKMRSLQVLQDFIDENIKHYQAEQNEYDKLLKYIQECLESIRRSCEEMLIVEIDKLSLTNI
jgi:DNA repair exonuclease SbcCD ATPase subunit